MSYYTQIDIANRALQHLGVPRITNFSDGTRQAREANFAVSKMRRVELQRSVWTFATKRAVMRKFASSTVNIFFAVYASGTTYAVGDIVADSNGFPWISLAGSNIGITPGAEGFEPVWIPYYGPVAAPPHDIATAFIPGDMVVASSVVYICVAANTNHAPPNTTYWHVVAGAATSSLVTLSPIGYERDITALRNIFRLPANYLRMAPQDPKAAAASRLNTTAGMAFNDWEIEEPYLYTNDDTGPFVMRFVADTTDVATMPPLFCEVWAARLAIEMADSLTQMDKKKADAQAAYQQYTTMAQTMNAIEAGTTENDPGAPAPPQQGQ